PTGLFALLGGRAALFRGFRKWRSCGHCSGRLRVVLQFLYPPGTNLLKFLLAQLPALVQYSKVTELIAGGRRAILLQSAPTSGPTDHHRPGQEHAREGGGTEEETRILDQRANRRPGCGKCWPANHHPGPPLGAMFGRRGRRPAWRTTHPCSIIALDQPGGP